MTRIKFALLTGTALTLGLTLAACSPMGKTSTQASVPAIAQMSKLSFEKEAKIGEEVPVEFKVTKDGAAGTATVTFKLKEMKEIAELDGTKPIAGQTFYYALYDLKGSSTITDKTSPNMVYDPSAPQLVLLNDSSMAEVGGSMPGAFSSSAAKQFKVQDPNLLKLTNPASVTTAAAWYVPQGKAPVLAIQYMDANGKKKYVKMNY